MQYTYLLINLLSVAVPFAFSFHSRLRFDKSWFAFGPAMLVTGLIFIAWDILFTHLGVWGFNPDYLTGIQILNLPLEEWLFFICIPYASVFTYSSLQVILKKDVHQNRAKLFSAVLAVALFMIGIWKWQAIYTSVTFIATAAFLMYHLVYVKANYLSRFYLTYLVIFAGPFLLVNGLLTGSFLSAPVVWYDNSQNLGVRAFSIPLEDFIYGFLLLLLNITIFEKLKDRKANVNPV